MKDATRSKYEGRYAGNAVSGVVFTTKNVTNAFSWNIPNKVSVEPAIALFCSRGCRVDTIFHQLFGIGFGCRRVMEARG